MKKKTAYKYSTRDRQKLLSAHFLFLYLVRGLRHQLHIPDDGFAPGSREHEAWLQHMMRRSDEKRELSEHYSQDEFSSLGAEINDWLTQFEMSKNTRDAMKNFVLFNDFSIGRPNAKVTFTLPSQKRPENSLVQINVGAPLSEAEKQEAFLLAESIMRVRAGTEYIKNELTEIDRDVFWYHLVMNPDTGEIDHMGAAIDIVIEEMGGVDRDEKGKMRDSIGKTLKRTRERIRQSFPPDSFRPL